MSAGIGTALNRPGLLEAEIRRLINHRAVESQIGFQKAELMWLDGPWRDVDHVEHDTLKWVP